MPSRQWDSGWNWRREGNRHIRQASAAYEPRISVELPARKRQRYTNAQISDKPLTMDLTATCNSNALSEMMLLVIGTHHDTVHECATNSAIAEWMTRNGWSKPENCMNTNQFDIFAYDHCSEVNRAIGGTPCCFIRSAELSCWRRLETLRWA